MKLWTLVPVVVVTVGCSGGSNDAPVGDKTSSGTPIVDNKKSAPIVDEMTTTEQEKFNDSVFKVPPYPGAQIMKFTSLEMSSDVAHSFNRHYKSADSVDKVIEHYTTEGSKIGKMVDTAITNKPGADLRVILVEFGPKEKLQVQAMKVPKGNYTDISVHLIETKK